MVEYLGGEHVYMHGKAKAMSEELRAIALIAKENTAQGRGASNLTANMYAAYHRKALSFVRGYGGEIMRGFYNLTKGAITENSSDRICPGVWAFCKEIHRFSRLQDGYHSGRRLSFGRWKLSWNVHIMPASKRAARTSTIFSIGNSVWGCGVLRCTMKWTQPYCLSPATIAAGCTLWP